MKTNNGMKTDERKRDYSPMTPEEFKWRASVEDPANVRRKLKLQYGMLGIWSALTVAWIIVLCLGIEGMSWSTVVVLISGYVSTGLGIINNKRLLAGKKPF